MSVYHVDGDNHSVLDKNKIFFRIIIDINLIYFNNINDSDYDNYTIIIMMMVIIIIIVVT